MTSTRRRNMSKNGRSVDTPGYEAVYKRAMWGYE
jgi:hypothetical protein